MRNIFKKSLFIALGCLWVGNIWAVDLVVSNTTAVSETFSDGSVLYSIDSDGRVNSSTKFGSGKDIISNGQKAKGAALVDKRFVIKFPVAVSSVTIYGYNTSSGRTLNKISTSTTMAKSSYTDITSSTTKNSSSTTPNYSYTFTANWANAIAADTYIWFEFSNSCNFYKISYTSSGGGPTTPTVNSVTVAPASVTLDPNDTKQLTATVDVTPSTADKSVSWTSSDANVASVSTSGLVTAVAQGTATITATSTLDNTKSGSCTVTVNAPATPIPVTAITLNKNATTIAVGGTETLTVSYTPEDANTGKGITWSSSDQSKATVDNSGKVTGVAAGTATITATSEGGKTATCEVTVQAVAVSSVTLTPTTASVQVNGTISLTATVLPADATNKNVSWSSSDQSKATVDNSGKVTGVAAGTAIITVTTVDGQKTATCSVTVTDAPPVPSTTLTIHLPEVYEAKEIAGGYGGTLSVVNGREYEVYYINRDGDNLGVSTGNIDKSGIISTSNDKQNATAKDGWFRIATSSNHGGDTNAAKADEFEASIRSVSMKDNDSIVLHIKGYDQFSFYGKDNGTDKDKYFHVYIDGVQQTQVSPESNYKIRRYDITPNEHVIRIAIKSGVTSSSKLTSFSLRLAEEPRVKYLDGNDSTQIVYQTQEVAPIYYYTKYNSKGRTKLIWDGTPATNLELSKCGSDQLGDTLVLGGPANCAVGVYSYHVVSYTGSNQETSSVPGKIKVETLLRPSSRDSVFDAFTGEEMDQIVFSYYALNPENDITLTWNGANPGNNVKGEVSGNKYIIHGVPANAGSFKFTVSIAGGNSFNGELKVTSIDLSDHPVMYLYKNSGAYDRDGVYQYLTSGVPNKLANLIPRKAQETGTRDSYSKYDWILISNDVDADNPEVLALIKDNIANKPILNMQGFTYTADRLNWGEPNNGTMDTISKNGCNIFIQQPNHPIFENIVYTQGTGKLKVLNTADKKSVMPININNCDGSICLATAYTRDIDDYYQDGEMQTIIHEVPFSKRGGKKYICFPLVNTKDNLTNEGKVLLKNIVTYLTNNKSTVTLPELKMQSFIVHGYTAQIDQEKDLITLELTEEQFEEADSLSAEKPIITVKDSKTHVLPAADEELDLRYTTFLPKTFVVTDYINRRAYSFKLIVKRPQGIDEVYTAGQWVNIFDIYGRKIATTNEDIYTMELPHGMYIVVTENGGTIKIMR